MEIPALTHKDAVARLRSVFGSLAQFEWSEQWMREDDTLYIRVIVEHEGARYRGAQYVMDGESVKRSRGSVVLHIEDQYAKAGR